MKTVTITRMVLDGPEREIWKTWGYDRLRMKHDEKKHGTFAVLVGTWSGYMTSQARVCYSEYVPYAHVDKIVLHSIVFTDGTTLDIRVERMTMEKLIGMKLQRIHGYDGLVMHARMSAQEIYEV